MTPTLAAAAGQNATNKFHQKNPKSGGHVFPPQAEVQQQSERLVDSERNLQNK